MSKIYAYGMISKSSLIRLDSPFPVENGYAEIADTHTMVSGETGNSAQVLAKWGHQVRVDGPWMGDNSADFISEYLTARNIDVSRLRKEPNYQGIEEIVLSAKSTRTVLGRYKQPLFIMDLQYRKLKAWRCLGTTVISAKFIFKRSRP